MHEAPVGAVGSGLQESSLSCTAAIKKAGRWEQAAAADNPLCALLFALG